MSVIKSELVTGIEGRFPLDLQEEWDNSGWQIDLLGADDAVSRVLVTLEITRETVDEAVRLAAACGSAAAAAAGAFGPAADTCFAGSDAPPAGAFVIVEHHPLLFQPPRDGKVIDASPEAPDRSGAYTAALIRAGISVYAAHTTFDTAGGGMNDALARAFGLADIEGFPEPKREPGGKWRQSIGRKGSAQGIFAEYISRAEELFDMKGRLKTIGNPQAQVRKAAVCGGAGGDFVPDAIREGADLYITSDVKHHEAQWARENGLMLIDGGHWGTEKIFVPVMAEHLRESFEGRLEVVGSAVNQDPWR